MDARNEDLPYQLPRDLYHQVIHALRAALPPPLTDSHEAQTSRDNAAIAQVASLLPANAEEAVLAAQFVAANAHALDCLRLIRDHPRDIRISLQCMAQAAGMMRQARSVRALLMRVQAQRQRREASHAATDSAASIEHCAIGLMTAALRPPPVPPQAAGPQVPAVEPTARAPELAATAACRGTGPEPAATPHAPTDTSTGATPEVPSHRPRAPVPIRRARDGPAARAA